MIRIKHTGNFKNTERFLSKAQTMNIRPLLDKYGSAGISALAAATPKDSGETSLSWQYKSEVNQWGYKIEWYNTNVNNGVPIAILIQYGHGTGTGGYVAPIDYINPAMKPIFDQMADELWREVTSL